MEIKDILKQPISRKPISANFIKSAKPEKLMIEPVRTVASFDEKGKENIELWLSFCAIGTTILDTGTKMLSHMGVIHKRDAIFDLITAFKQLRKHFSGNDNFDTKERELDDFFYTFLTSNEETQHRVIKFQESILNKNDRAR
jgi:hypothetical protein